MVYRENGGGGYRYIGKGGSRDTGKERRGGYLSRLRTNIMNSLNSVVARCVRFETHLSILPEEGLTASITSG